MGVTDKATTLFLVSEQPGRWNGDAEFVGVCRNHGPWGTPIGTIATSGDKMRPGIYALVLLDGAGPDPADVQALGLKVGNEIKAVDVDANAVHLRRNDRAITAFAGYLDEQQELAAELGFAPETDALSVALAAVEQFGAEAAGRMVGEWSFLHWDLEARRLVLLTSESWRDAMYFATDGRQVAVSPSALSLCNLPWVGRTLDPEGFLLGLGRAGVRQAMGDKSIWQGIRRSLPGWREEFTTSGRKSYSPVPRVALPMWRGSFEEAVEELKGLGRRIVKQHMRRAGKSAFLLSGGLDSTLLSSLGAAERGFGAEMFCITSVAPEGSGSPDEREFSTAAAEMLGVDLKFVVPEAEVGAYQPSSKTFEHMEHALVSQRGYLIEALLGEARVHGATSVFDGVAGELSITFKPQLGSRLWWLRRWRFQALLWWEEHKTSGSWPVGAFHARISPARLETLPKVWKESWRRGHEQWAPHEAGKPVGIHPAIRKTTTGTTWFGGGLRRVLPYEDRRLLRLAGSFPGELYSHGGENRALARAMLRGRVPEKVRMRQEGLPFSPDYRMRTRTHASAVLERLPAFREAGAADWLNLAWLEVALKQIAAGRAAIYVERQAEITAATAEFLCWLKDFQ